MAADLQFTAGLDAAQVSAGLNKISGGMNAVKQSARTMATELGSAGASWAASFAGNLASAGVTAAIGKTKAEITDAIKTMERLDISSRSVGITTGGTVPALKEMKGLAEEMSYDVDKISAAFAKISFEEPGMNLAKISEAVKAGIELERIRGEVAGDMTSASIAVANLADAYALTTKEAQSFALELSKVAGMSFPDMINMVERLSSSKISPEGILAFNTGMQRADVTLRKSLPILEAIITNTNQLKDAGFNIDAGIPNLIKQINAATGGQLKTATGVLGEKQLNVLKRADIGAMERTGRIPGVEVVDRDLAAMQGTAAKTAEAWSAIGNTITASDSWMNTALKTFKLMVVEAPSEMLARSVSAPYAERLDARQRQRSEESPNEIIENQQGEKVLRSKIAGRKMGTMRDPATGQMLDASTGLPMGDVVKAINQLEATVKAVMR